MGDYPMPHDLIWGMPSDALGTDAPAWAVLALKAGHPVVVRRAEHRKGHIAIGIRGSTRALRLAGNMAVIDVSRRLRPEQLTETRLHASHPVFETLQVIKPILNDFGLPWGITGGAGYTLATGFDVLRLDSDLDLLIRSLATIEPDRAHLLLERLETHARCRLDVQIETPQGGLALREWARHPRRVLVKTARGPLLMADPWDIREQAA